MQCFGCPFQNVSQLIWVMLYSAIRHGVLQDLWTTDRHYDSPAPSTLIVIRNYRMTFDSSLSHDSMIPLPGIERCAGHKLIVEDLCPCQLRPQLLRQSSNEGAFQRFFQFSSLRSPQVAQCTRGQWAYRNMIHDCCSLTKNILRLILLVLRTLCIVIRLPRPSMTLCHCLQFCGISSGANSRDGIRLN